MLVMTFIMEFHHLLVHAPQKTLIIIVFEEMSTVRVVLIKVSVDLHSKFRMNKLEDYPMMNPKTVLHLGIVAPTGYDTLFELVVVGDNLREQ